MARGAGHEEDRALPLAQAEVHVLGRERELRGGAERREQKRIVSALTALDEGSEDLAPTTRTFAWAFSRRFSIAARDSPERGSAESSNVRTRSERMTTVDTSAKRRPTQACIARKRRE